MSRTLTYFAFSVAVVYMALCFLLFAFQRSFIYFPQPRALGDTESLATLRTKDAELVLTVKHNEGRHALIYFGGNAEDVSLTLPGVANAFPDHALYLLHYRGYGGSSGSPSEAALQKDALALFDHVVARHPNPRVTVIGRSLGSGIAIRLAAERPVARLILVTPFYSILELASRQFPYLPVRFLLLDKYESWRHAPGVRAPTTLIIAEHDRIIPPESALRLATHFGKDVVRTDIIPGADHNTVSDTPAYWHAVRREKVPVN